MVRSEKSNVIPINDQYRITSDRYQWMIQEKRNRTGKAEEWEPKSYFPTLEGAVKGLGEQMVRLSGAESIEELIKATENVTTTLSRALPPEIEVVLKASGAGQK